MRDTFRWAEAEKPHFLGSNFLRAITVQGSMLPFCPGFFCLYSEKGHERGTPSKIIQNSEEKKIKSKTN